MSNRYANIVVASMNPPQSEPFPGMDQIKNDAGGYVFKLDKWAYLERFLILGTDSGTYYASEKNHTLKAVDCLKECVTEDPLRVITSILRIDRDNRAPRMSVLIFALAYAHSQDKSHPLAFQAAMKKLLRTGTHLFEYYSILKSLGVANGRQKRNAIEAWLNGLPAERLAYQAAKYANREGFTWKDLLRLTHPKANTPAINTVLKYLAGKEENPPSGILEYAKEAKTADASRLIELIGLGVTHEMIPSESVTKEVLMKLGSKMPATALLRNLGRFGTAGIMDPSSDFGIEISKRLSDLEFFKKGRVHPLTVLSAWRTYSQGHGFRGSNTWKVNPQVSSSLEELFYGSFSFIEPTNKKILLGVDTSGSMGGGEIAGLPGLSPRDGAAIMSMLAMRTEPNAYIIGFDNKIFEVKINKNTSLDEAVKRLNISVNGTDCSLPIDWARRAEMKVDAIVEYTDGETWAGKEHVHKVIKDYRKWAQKDTRFIVSAMTATQCTIADPKDPFSMNIVGFDSNAPLIMNEFIKEIS